MSLTLSWLIDVPVADHDNRNDDNDSLKLLAGI